MNGLYNDEFSERAVRRQGLRERLILGTRKEMIWAVAKTDRHLHNMYDKNSVLKSTENTDSSIFFTLNPSVIIFRIESCTYFYYKIIF